MALARRLEPATPGSQKSRTRRGRRWVLALASALLLLAAVHWSLSEVFERRLASRAVFGDEDVDARQIGTLASAGRHLRHEAGATGGGEVSPFREIRPLDDDALEWSNISESLINAGALVFDANGDGRLDLYLAHNGSSWTRPTDAAGVLLDEPRRQHNGLYLNLGNDDRGDPIFAQASELAKANDTFVEAELLVENYLFARQRADEPPRSAGRSSVSATAADLDGDGRLDLVVANGLEGLFWSHPKTQRVLGQFVRPVGRQVVHSKLPLPAIGLFFLKDYRPREDTDEWRVSSRGREPMGANSVFRNLGDADGDGLPEWQDVSRVWGLEGKRATTSLVVADFDRDGDLDVFEANTIDLDYWPGGSKSLAGGANQLYLNQLAETGRVEFVETAGAWNVDGVYDRDNPMPFYYRLRRFPLLPDIYSAALFRWQPYQPSILDLDGERAEPAEISWAAVAQDVDDDGFPDLWVANDLGYLRLYRNQRGHGFAEARDHARARYAGFWMSLSPADFDGDLREDLFAGNMGGSTMNIAVASPDPRELLEPTITAGLMAQQYLRDRTRSTHALIDGRDYRRELRPRVRHSQVLPPDSSLPNNLRSFDGKQAMPFDLGSLDPYEFAWGSTALDVQGDGRPDLYWVGNLYGRGGGIFPIMGTGPGRLLVNTTRHAGAPEFADLTAEHHLFNIEELRYDRLASDGYVYRPSPTKSWGKRSMVYSYEVSVWGYQGPGLVERITNHDLVQAAENGRAAVGADLNGDGLADLVVTNLGGYDSRSSKATNLKARIDGRVAVLPSPDPNYPTLTNLEPGRTRVFINTYPPRHWIRVSLRDDHEGSRNPFAVGARVVLNGAQLAVVRAGSGGFTSNSFGPILFGLGDDVAHRIEIRWPSGEVETTSHDLPDYHNGTVTISRTAGVVAWRPEAEVRAVPPPPARPRQIAAARAAATSLTGAFR